MAGTPGDVITGNIAAFRQAEENVAVAVRAAGFGIDVGLRAVGAEIVNRIKVILSRPGHGRLYRRRSVTHRASAPGEPPAVDTGRLRASYTHTTGRGGGEVPFLEVGTNVEYAPYLEFGTRNMEARPHFRPAVEGFNVREFAERMRSHIEAEQRKLIGELRRSGRGFIR